jgi:hypothetical protein
MMPGVAAQPLPHQPTGGGGITNTWSLNFLTETCTLNGSPVTLSTIIDKPERVGASGLEVLSHNASGSVLPIGDLFTDLAGVVSLGGTVFIEWEELVDTDRTVLLYMEDFEASDKFDIERDLGDGMWAYGQGTDFRSVNDSDNAYEPGIHKVAVTYTDTFIAMSIDGRAALVDTTANVMNPMVAIYLGGFEATSKNALYYRKITLTAPVASSLLPSLSA